MQDLPAPADLVASVADFLRTDVMPATQGAMNFQLRVAVNALDLVTRQLRIASRTDAEEHARLVALLSRDGSLDELNEALSAAVADGSLTLETRGLADHLWATTMAKVAVDQPNYASYRRESERYQSAMTQIYSPHSDDARSAVSKDGPMP